MAVGLVVVGLGDVGSSLLAGVEAARAHLVHPWGSLAEAGGVGRTPEQSAAARPYQFLQKWQSTAQMIGSFAFWFAWSHERLFCPELHSSFDARRLLTIAHGGRKVAEAPL